MTTTTTETPNANEYKDLLAQVRGGEANTPAPAATSGEDYAGLLAQVRKQKPQQQPTAPDFAIVEVNLSTASFGNPDEAAQRETLARQLKAQLGEDWSPAAVDPAEAQRRLKIAENDHALRNAPKLAKRYLDTGFAERAFDDTGILAKIERTASAVGAGAAQAAMGMAESVLRTPEAAGRVAEYVAQQIERTGLPWYLNPVRGLQSTAEFVARGKIPGQGEIGGASTQADRVKSAQAMLASDTDTFGPTFARMAQKGQQADAAFSSLLKGDAAPVGAVLSDPEAWAGFIGQAMPSLYAAIKSGGSLPFMAWMEGMQTANDAAAFEQQTGVKVAPSNYTAALAEVALVNSWLEKVGLDKVLAAKGAQGVKANLRSILGAIFGEGGTEGLQQLNSNIAQWVAYKPDQNLGEGVLASIMGGAGSGGGARGMIAITNAAASHLATKTAEAADTVQAADTLRQVATLAAESKLRARDADSFAAFVQQIAEDGGRVPSSVFIDGATLADALAQEGVNADAIKGRMQSLDQLDEAVSTQGMVEIPVGEFAAHLTGKPYTDTLLQHLRTEPDAPTLAEAGAYLQSADAGHLRDEVARLASEQAADLAQESDHASIRNSIAAQLDQTGRFSPDVNRIYAELHAAFFTTMADRLGATPAHVFEQYRANIAGEALPGASALDQGPRRVVDILKSWLQPDATGYAQGNRGAFVPKEHTPDGRPLIALLKNADLSTFLHESGHYFLENFADMAKSAPALQKDMQTLLAWFGVPDFATWQGMSLEQRRQHHEKFARGFEHYLYEGRAPSLEIQGMFARFRAWLMRVYGSLRGELTDSVRTVMDRMLATDAQIKLAEQSSALRPLFRTAEEAQRFGVNFAEYQNIAQEAKTEALAALESRSLRGMRWIANAKKKAVAGITTEAADIRRKIEAEVRAEVSAQPVYRALRWLKQGEMTTPEGEEIKAQAGHRLSIPALKGMYPTRAAASLSTAPEWTKLGYGAAGMLANDGLHPDLVAEMFGFSSGDQLVRTLLDTPSLDDVVEGLTDKRMLEEHGDMIDPDAIERAAEASVHNQARQRMVAAELAALQNANRGQARLLAHAAKSMAARVVGEAKVGTLRPRLFTIAAAKAARAAEDAVRRGDIQTAIAQKRTQLLNNALARQAFEAKDEIAKGEALFRDIAHASDERVGKSRNMDLVNAARAILAEYGAVTDGTLGKVTRYMEALRAYDPELSAVLDPQIAAAVDGARPLREITVGHFRALRDQVESLWYMSRRAKEVEIDGRLVDRDDITQALTARLEELGVPLTAPGENQAVTEREKRVRYLHGARAALRRVEHWVDRMDGGDITGAFRTYLWNPISEAADRYRSDSAKYLAQYRDLIKAIEPSLAPGKIEAPELGYTFGHAQGGMGKVELLHAILHTGNESNMRKLLLGRNWGAERADGTVDTTRWEAFMRRLISEGKLTKADFDFAQGVWDLLEEVKPLAQKTHREVFGRYFDEVTARQVATPFGLYRGGYVPALVDTFTTQDDAVRAELEAINQSNGYMFPATSRGFTKGRVEYNRPLLLDLRTIGQHIDKVLLFAHMEGRVRDTMRVLKAKGFAGTMSRYDAVAYTDMLLPWLNRAARQTVETPTTGWGGKLGDRFFRAMRTRAGLAAMFANVTNALQQVTGISIAALKVKPRHLAAAAMRYVKAPGQMANEIAELSSFMAQRQHNETMAMRQEIEQLLVNPSAYDKAQAWAAKHGYFLQSAMQNVVDTITWAAAYDQATAAGESEVNAIRAADSAVRETQGSLSPEDVSRWETGPAFVRLFTQFQGYFNMQANILGTEFAKVAQDIGLRKGAGRLFYIYMLGFMVPAVIAEAIVQGMKGGPGDDDDDGYLDEFLAAFFGAQFRTAAAMLPVVGQVSVVAANTFNRKPYDDRMSTAPAVSMIESAASAPHSVYKTIVENGSGKRAIRDTLTLVSIMTGIPVAALGKPLGYAADVAEGRVDPSGPIDATRGAISGAASPGTRYQ